MRNKVQCILVRYNILTVYCLKMANLKKFNIADKSKIITLKYEMKLSNREISRRMQCSESAIRGFLKRYSKTLTFDRKKGTGMQRSTTKREDRYIKNLMVNKRSITIQEIRAELNESNMTVPCKETVRLRLKEMGFSSKRPAKKPLLTKKMQKTRLKWAKDHRLWTVTDWNRVIFSDESKFMLFGNDASARVWRKPNERYSENCILKTVKHSPYVMVWGCITAFGVGMIDIITGSINGERYRKVIDDLVLPSLDELCQYVENPIFQDDSAPCHRAKIVSHYFDGFTETN